MMRYRFEVGDIVTVVDDPKMLRVHGDGGKNPAYVPPMDKFCGEEAVVIKTAATFPEPSYQLRMVDGGFSIWWFCESHIVSLEENDELNQVDSDELMKLVFG